MNKDYKLNSIVMMKKQHPCSNDLFKVIRVGVDVKIECVKCKRVILIPQVEFSKKIKRVVSYDGE